MLRRFISIFTLIVLLPTLSSAQSQPQFSLLSTNASSSVSSIIFKSLALNGFSPPQLFSLLSFTPSASTSISSLIFRSLVSDGFTLPAFTLPFSLTSGVPLTETMTLQAALGLPEIASVTKIETPVSLTEIAPAATPSSPITSVSNPASIPTSLNWEYPQSQVAPASSLSMTDLAAIFNEQGPNTAYYVGNDVKSSGMGAHVMKILQTNDLSHPYIALFHWSNATHLAYSTDLKNWTTFSQIDTASTMPTAAILPDNSVLYAAESNLSGNRPFINVRYYATLAAFLANPSSPTKSIDLPQTAGASADGTPTFGRITYSGDINHSSIEITHHYFENSVRDRQAVGTLTNFTSWSGGPDTKINAAMDALGYPDVGDRAIFKVGSTVYELLEANLAEPTSSNGWDKWRIFLVNTTTGEIRKLSPAIPGGAYSVGNPTMTFLTLPDARPALVVQYFLFSEGAASTPAGPHLYIYPL